MILLEIQQRWRKAQSILNKNEHNHAKPFENFEMNLRKEQEGVINLTKEQEQKKSIINLKTILCELAQNKLFLNVNVLICQTKKKRKRGLAFF